MSTKRAAVPIAKIVRVSLDRGLRFTQALEHLRESPGDFPGTGLDSLLIDYDAIIATGREISSVEEEVFLSWVERVFTIIGLSAEKRNELDVILEPLLEEFERNDDETSQNSDYVGAVVGAMTLVGDTKPPRKTGEVTTTTMHGAKGLSADVVITSSRRAPQVMEKLNSHN